VAALVALYEALLDVHQRDLNALGRSTVLPELFQVECLLAERGVNLRTEDRA
jgi:hypothetical protein